MLAKQIFKMQHDIVFIGKFVRIYAQNCTIIIHSNEQNTAIGIHKTHQPFKPGDFNFLTEFSAFQIFSHSGFEFHGFTFTQANKLIDLIFKVTIGNGCFGHILKLVCVFIDQKTGHTKGKQQYNSAAGQNKRDIFLNNCSDRLFRYDNPGIQGMMLVIQGKYFVPPALAIAGKSDGLIKRSFFIDPVGNGVKNGVIDGVMTKGK